ERPFRAPHHTTSDVALVGGGSVPRPGEVSLAHNGVLFLDEVPEFRRHVLEVLRQPLEGGCVTGARARGSLHLPAPVPLVAAMNPCPCGGGGPGSGCRCTPNQQRTYRGRVSGPLLDRIDLQVEVPALPYADLSAPSGEASSAIALRVAEARNRQLARSAATGARTNATLSAASVRRVAIADSGGTTILEAAVDRLGLTARAHDRVLRVARTLADLEGSEQVAA